MNYTFTYILCILWVLFYINVFHKINKIYHKTLHCIFLKSLHKNKRSFFPQKMFFSNNIYQKKSYQKKSCNAQANNQSIYIIKAKNWEKIQLDFKLDSNCCLILCHVSNLSLFVCFFFLIFFKWFQIPMDSPFPIHCNILTFIFLFFSFFIR